MSLTMTLPATDYIPTRYSLLSRLQNRDDQDSWRDFFETYWRLIYAMALKAGLTEAEAEDVVQETIICVVKDLEKFKRDKSLGSFKGWLRNLTRWRIADQFKKRERAIPTKADSAIQNGCQIESVEIVDASESSLEKIWEEEWQTNLMAAAMERIKIRVKEEHFQIFDLMVTRLWPASRVASVLGINIAQVYLAKHRVLRLIKQEIRLLEQQW